MALAAVDLENAQRRLSDALAPEKPSLLPHEQEDQRYGAGFTDEKILQLVTELEQESSKIREREEKQWLTAWRYYNGRHWGEWNEKGELVDVEDEDIPRLVLNYILHLVQTKLSHLLKTQPILSALPGRPDEKSRNATRLAVRVMEAYWRKLQLPKKLGEALLWTLVCGKAFWKVYWDPTLGKPIQLMGPPKRVPRLNEAGEPLVDSTTGEAAFDEQPNPLPPVREGDACVCVAFPHEIHIDAGAMDIDRANRLLHTTPRPLHEVLRRWGPALGKEGIDKIRQEAKDGSSDEEPVRRELESLLEAAGGSLANRVLVKELWVRSDPYDFPRGLRAVIISGKVVEKGPTPSGYPEIPFIEFDELKTNSFWSTSTARQLLDINQCINIEISQQEHVRQVLRYKTLIPEQGNIDKDAIDRSDSEIVTYWHPFAPSHLAPPNIAPHHIEIRNSLISILKEIGGSLDVMSGNMSGQGDVRSGRQTAYLQEYAGVLLALVAGQVVNSLTQAGNFLLKILQGKAREDRFEAFVGRDRRAQVVAFKGADLEGCGEIIVQPSASLMMSRAEKMDRIEHWMEAGWLDPKIGMRLLDVGDFDTELYAVEEQHRQNADEMIYRLQAVTEQQFQAAKPRAEQLAMAEGNLMSERYILRALGIEAFIFDNHTIHQKQIDEVHRLTRSYRDESPDWKRALADALFEWHTLLGSGGPIETPIDPSLQMPTGTEVVPGLPVPLPSEGEGGGAAPVTAELTPNVADGTPGALKGQPPGGGGVGGGGDRPWVAESGAENATGLPSVPRPPGPGRGPGPLGG